MRTDNIKMLAEGKISKTLLRLCFPAVAAMTINGIYNVVDAFFIGLTNNNGAIGAISIIFPLFIIQTAIGLGISVGASSFMSRSLGAGSREKAEKAADAALYFSFLSAALITVFGSVFMKPFLYMLGARELIMPYAVDYTSWIIYGSFFAITNTTFAGTIRAEGNTIYSTIALLAGTVLNIVLDPLFIFTFNLGIKGAAIATFISYILTFIISIFYYISKKSALKIRLKINSINKENTFEIIKIGIPAMVKQLLLGVVFCMVNIFAVAYGESAVTAIGICNKINSFVAMTAMGVTQGFSPVAAFNYGAGNYKRIFDALKKIFNSMFVFAVFSAALYLIFGKNIMEIFCREPMVIEIGEKALIAFAAGVVPMSIAFLMDSLFFSCGKAKASMLLSFSRQGFVFIPVLFTLKALFGLDGIIWSSAAADIVSCIFIILPLFALFLKEKNRQQSIVIKENNI